MFTNPVEVVECADPQGVENALTKIDQARKRGLYAAGFLSYELGYLLEPKLQDLVHQHRQVPLIWMGLFHEPQRIDFLTARSLVDWHQEDNYSVEELQLSLDQEDYIAAVQRVKAYIASGDVYQINLTFKYLFKFIGNPWSLYAALRRRQQVEHGAFIQTSHLDILSLSPELFIQTNGELCTVRPMKGTAPRGSTLNEDESLRTWLKSDEKSLAENLMIVDLLRNDLGRIADIGSVNVMDLFAVETFPTLHQMTSTVTANLSGELTASRLIKNLFPCGSITGAPKVRAIEIIRELEAQPRGVYTGAIGMFSPNNNVYFNVAIRTLVLDQNGKGEIGIGSGIVHDSDASSEYEECLLKAQFLTQSSRGYKLIETIRWQSESGYYLLESHLARLDNSARHFGIAYDKASVLKNLHSLVYDFNHDVVRVRLLLDEFGTISLSHSPTSIPGPDECITYIFSEKPVYSHDIFRFHKTTNRQILDSEYERITAQTGCSEVLFLNEHGEVTEGSRSNLFLEKDGVLITSPISCGVLFGTLRRSLLNNPNIRVIEKKIYPDDLKDSEQIFLGNSVMGLVKARPHHLKKCFSM